MYPERCNKKIKLNYSLTKCWTQKVVVVNYFKLNLEIKNLKTLAAQTQIFFITTYEPFEWICTICWKQYYMHFFLTTEYN